MKRFEIGRGVTCDLDRLVDTRLLVQANSGGGKSWLLRRLLEQTHGQVQHLVIDPEGEFASLRERFDYVLAAKHDGDTAADPRSATLLAERLLELKVSAILDIYELKPHERIRFVRLFLEALIDAPKVLWHPALVVVDEAHVYCPQVGEAESAGAVKDLATRGRKRGFCALLATQRLSKLHKDAAAECNNKLIGRTSLDVDMKRAADELGLITREDTSQLRLLPAGGFFAFGPAFNHDAPTRVTVGSVETTHPKAGARLAFTAPPPTSKVKALLPKLADLPAEAEERVKSVDALKRELAEARRDLAAAQRATPAARVETVETFVLKDGQLRRAEGIVSAIANEVTRHEAAVKDRLDLLRELTQELAGAIEKTRAPQPRQPERDGRQPAPSVAARPASVPTPRRAPQGDGTMKGMHRAMLTALAQHPDGLSKKKILIHTGYASSGPVSGAFADMVRDGWVENTGAGLRITPAGLGALGSYDPLPVGDALREHLLTSDKLSGMERTLLGAICDAYPDAIRKGQVLEKTGYASSGPVSNSFAKLVGLGYAVAQGPGLLKATDELFG